MQLVWRRREPPGSVYKLNGRMKFLVVVLLLHLPLFAYPVLRIGQWLELDAWLIVAIFVPTFFSQIIARIYLRHANSGVIFWIRRLADLWLGVSPLLLVALLMLETPVAMQWLTAKDAAIFLILVTTALLVYSVYNAYSPHVVPVVLESAKISTPLRFAQITDVHIGSRSSDFLARVMNKVNALDIEFLCITGDFIDAPNVGVDRLHAMRNCSFPVFFSIGNHERYEDLDDILGRLDELGFRVLRSETASRGETQIVGIDDSDDTAQVERELARIELNADQFVLLLYHRPHGLEDAAAAGVDLMISGHTHNGQIVPFNLVVGRVFKRVVGLFREGMTYLYVSPGTGTWGPIMRLGSRGEITHFEIRPASAA